ncbi:uncharacterized protein N0V89_000310 [Didymosphaeria variabile]|uniref:DNA replication checkpoint mediator MRC1 domain-containing protein n=1 Tax=Didymosphaeria variabile TaxID=1932322 RepID=A0A9W8XU21_9PLEO|nr:uncharacterized protein N0V89_000310 [Didymosphaeria variabile]KAJ4359754.1 hypothetical protein N0V89_000310 [Didymosphaeria variabile]
MAATMSSTEARRSTSPNTAHSIQPPLATNALSKLAESESESDKDEALVRRTTGRLLSRLQQNTTENSSEEEQGDSDEDAYERTKRRLAAVKPVAASSGEEEEDNGQGAYERIKQRLLASTGLERRRATPTQEAQKRVVTTAALSSEDEDDAPVRANRVRKLQTRPERTGSPAVSSPPRARSRQPSLGLFVTPESSPVKRPTRDANLSDDALERTTPRRSNDFRERVERIRAERLAKRSEEKQRRTKTSPQGGDQEPGSNSDGEGSRRLTQLAKPTRKAGKKALEAMARDQQRIVRNMQLTHQAKTKKRYGTKDLFAKFGFNQSLEESDPTGLPTPETSSVPATSDVEAAQARDTPPTSPPSFEDGPKKDETLTGPEPMFAVPTKTDKGKGRAPEFEHLPPNQMMEMSQSVTAQNTHVVPNKSTSEIMVDLDDSDDELQVVKPKSRFPVFDRLPAKKERESSSLLHLRHLAQLTSPGKKGSKGKKTMNMVQLQSTLFQKARQQAQKERQEKIEMLRAKGIIVETEEEKEKRQTAIEDLVAQFEKEKEKDLKLAKRERELAKKNGEVGDGLASSDEEEDEDYVASGDEEDAAEDLKSADEVELELSGSEDEEADDEQELDDDAENEEDHPEGSEADAANALIDAMADEDDEEEPHQANKKPQDREDDDLLDAKPQAAVRKGPAKRTRKVVVDDDDEDEGSTMQLHGSPTQVATQDDTMAAFGFGNVAPAIGLTQAFAGTMAILDVDSQADQPLPEEPEQDSIDFLRSLPDSQPNFSQNNDVVVPNSQAAASQQEFTQDGSLPMSLGISQLMEETTIFSHTQASEVPEPTQDAGFLLSRSPAGLVAPQSTIDTVMLPVAESPIAQRKGKLSRRRKEAPVVLSDVDDENVFSASEAEAKIGRPATEDAFSFLKKAAKKQNKIDTFNKKTSAAREHLDEQAYESDDEYKGIGGASDEDSGEEDADLAEMIDTSDVKVDERKIAALFADKARKEHDASVAKIYKDLQTGAFRKRGAGDAFDMSDSEDELEMRKRKKQREFDQMFRALKQDQAIGKMAENPKRKAFFATIMDHSDDFDLEFLDHPEEPTANSASQSDDEKQDMEEASIVPDSQTAGAPIDQLKRRSADSQEKENRPPPHLRRTAAADAMTRRPISAADIKDSVAELLEDPRDVVPDSQYISLSDSEDESSTTVTRTERIVTNRLSRTPSLATESSTTSNMAFQTPSAGSVGGFRVPSLIRRATSNLSAASERSTTSMGKSSEGGVRRGGTGKSNIHAQAREAERRAVLEKVEGRRKEALKKKVGMARGKRSVLSRLSGGFE